MVDRLVIEAAIGERRAALLSGDRVVEFHIAPDDDPDLTGAVFTAGVVEFQPKTDSLFLDLGGGLHGMLTGRHRLSGRDIGEGDRIMVQLRQHPGGGGEAKAVSVTEKIRLAGRYVTVTRGDDGPLVNRHEVGPSQPGAAEAEQATLEAELAALAPAARPGLLRPPPDLLSRLMCHRSPDTEIIVSNADLLASARRLTQRWPDLADTIQPWQASTPPFGALDLDDQLDQALAPTVALRSGGWIAVERTRALLAVDVNAGTAATGATGMRPEEAVNTEALEAVLARLRLCNIGGLVAVDLLDMGKAARKRIVERARTAAATDPCQIDVGGFAPFQVLMMTRARRGRDLADILLTPPGQTMKPVARARALLRRAEAEARHNVRPGRLVLQATPSVHAVLTTRRKWLETLERGAGQAVDLRQAPIDADDEAFMERP